MWLSNEVYYILTGKLKIRISEKIASYCKRDILPLTTFVRIRPLPHMCMPDLQVHVAHFTYLLNGFEKFDSENYEMNGVTPRITDGK